MVKVEAQLSLGCESKEALSSVNRASLVPFPLGTATSH